MLAYSSRSQPNSPNQPAIFIIFIASKHSIQHFSFYAYRLQLISVEEQGLLLKISHAILGEDLADHHAWDDIRNDKSL